MSKINRLLGSMAFSPLLWGVLATFLFYSALDSGVLGNPWLERLFGGHGASQVVAIFFFVGLISLAMRAANLLSQQRLLNVALLDGIPEGGQPLADADTLLTRLEGHSAKDRESYLIRRLREALEYVYRKNSADTIEDELRHLSLMDRQRMHDGYSFVRCLTWAVGLTGIMAAAIALGDAVEANSVWTDAANVVALAAVLVAGLRLATHAVQRFESNLLAGVDARVAAELIGRFELAFNPAADPEIAVIRAMGDRLMRTIDESVTRQSDLWKATFHEAEKQWTAWSMEATRQLQESLGATLAATMQAHAATLAEAAKISAAENAAKWNEVQQALLQNAEAVTLQQRELVKQGEVLTQVVAATGQVEKLEAELNRNLSTLAGAKNFEQTVLSLGAAIQLLNSKLGALPTPETPQVQLKAKRGKAA